MSSAAAQWEASFFLPHHPFPYSTNCCSLKSPRLREFWVLLAASTAGCQRRVMTFQETPSCVSSSGSCAWRRKNVGSITWLFTNILGTSRRQQGLGSAMQNCVRLDLRPAVLSSCHSENRLQITKVWMCQALQSQPGSEMLAEVGNPSAKTVPFFPYNMYFSICENNIASLLV